MEDQTREIEISRGHMKLEGTRNTRDQTKPNRDLRRKGEGILSVGLQALGQHLHLAPTCESSLWSPLLFYLSTSHLLGSLYKP